MSVTRASEELREQFEQLLTLQQQQFTTQLDTVAATIGAHKDIIPVAGGEGLTHFSGAMGESFEEWLKRFNRLAQANNWTPEKKRDVFPWFLRGLAEQKYDALSQAEKASFDLIVSNLEDKLKYSCMSDLRSVELHVGDFSVGDFSQAIRKHRSRAYAKDA